MPGGAAVAYRLIPDLDDDCSRYALASFTSASVIVVCDGRGQICEATRSAFPCCVTVANPDKAVVFDLIVDGASPGYASSRVHGEIVTLAPAPLSLGGGGGGA